MQSSAFHIVLTLSDPDTPNFLSIYSIQTGTDYAQQTVSMNAIDDQVITQERKTICYDQPIYDDRSPEGLEYFGLSLAVAESGVFTTLRPMYDQAAIVTRDNDG